MRISDWSSDVCSSDLHACGNEGERDAAASAFRLRVDRLGGRGRGGGCSGQDRKSVVSGKSAVRVDLGGRRCLKKKTTCCTDSMCTAESTISGFAFHKKTYYIQKSATLAVLH